MMDEDDIDINTDGTYLENNMNVNVTNSTTPIHDIQNTK